MWGLPFLFPATAVQYSPLSSRPWTPTSAVLEDEITYFHIEEIKIIRQELLHLPFPTYSNIFPHPYWLLVSCRGQFFPKEQHLCPGLCPFLSLLAPRAINYPFTSLVLSFSTGSLPLVLKYRIKYTASYKWISKQKIKSSPWPHPLISEVPLFTLSVPHPASWKDVAFVLFRPRLHGQADSVLNNLLRIFW